MTALKVSGLVENEIALQFEDFQQINAAQQIEDISSLMPGRTGQAITLIGLVDVCHPSGEAEFLGLHGSLDVT